MQKGGASPLCHAFQVEQQVVHSVSIFLPLDSPSGIGYPIVLDPVVSCLSIPSKLLLSRYCHYDRVEGRAAVDAGAWAISGHLLP